MKKRAYKSTWAMLGITSIGAQMSAVDAEQEQLTENIVGSWQNPILADVVQLDHVYSLAQHLSLIHI